jgi:hypothetical protein
MLVIIVMAALATAWVIGPWSYSIASKQWVDGAGISHVDDVGKARGIAIFGVDFGCSSPQLTSSRSSISGLAPSARRRWHNAKPMPEAAPLLTTTVSSKFHPDMS